MIDILEWYMYSLYFFGCFYMLLHFTVILLPLPFFFQFHALAAR